MHDCHPLGSAAGDDAAEAVAEGAGDVVGEGAAEIDAEGAAERVGKAASIEAVAVGRPSLAGADGEATEQPAASTAAVAKAAKRYAGRRVG